MEIILGIMNDHHREKYEGWKERTALFCFIFPDGSVGGVGVGGVCVQEIKCVFCTLKSCRAY